MPGKPFPELKIVAHFRTARINSHVTASTEGQAGVGTRDCRAFSANENDQVFL